MEKDIAFAEDSEKSVGIVDSACNSAGYDLEYKEEENLVCYDKNSASMNKSANLSNIGNGIGNANLGNGIAINSSPWVASTWGTNESYLDETRSVYELKLVSGKKIVKEFGWRDISRIEETEDEHQKKSLTVTFKDGDVVNVACSIRMFMSLIKKKYNSWATGVITEQIANGTDV